MTGGLSYETLTETIERLAAEAPARGHAMLVHPVHYIVLEACERGADRNRRGLSDRRKMKRIYRKARQAVRRAGAR